MRHRKIAFLMFVVPILISFCSPVFSADPDPQYLMVAQRAGNNNGTEDADDHFGIYLLDSIDGARFEFVNPERMIHEIGDAATRDGAIFYQKINGTGYFFLMWPHTPAAVDNNHFDFYYSADLINWTYLDPFTLAGATGTGGGNWQFFKEKIR